MKPKSIKGILDDVHKHGCAMGCGDFIGANPKRKINDARLAISQLVEKAYEKGYNKGLMWCDKRKIFANPQRRRR